MVQQLRELIIHLSLIDGVGPVAVQQLLRRAFGLGIDGVQPPERLVEPVAFYTMIARDFVMLGLSPRLATVCVQGLKNQRLLDDELALTQQYGVQLITCVDVNYPPLLAKVRVPPAVLWVQGNIIAERKRIAIVGSRNADSYAGRALRLIVPELVDAGYEVVSGGAIGVDTLAHRMALERHGVTSAILGSGLACLYPARNKTFFFDIVAGGGALISPFPMKTAPLPGNFPARNRVIAGMSCACLVVQAAATSGALITAAYALEEGRDVWAVPGPIDSPLSAGTNQLLKDGAGVATSGCDIVAALEGQPLRAVGAVQSELFADDLTVRLLDELHQHRSMDELQIALQLEEPALIELLFSLQLAGLIRQTSGGLWERR